LIDSFIQKQTNYAKAAIKKIMKHGTVQQ